MATLATQKGLKQYIGEQETSAGESTITFNHKDKKIKEPVGKHYNMSDHKCKDTTVVVIDHNPH